VSARIVGFNSYEVRQPIDFSHDLNPTSRCYWHLIQSFQGVRC